MKLVIISVLLFCFIFVLSIPMKMKNDRLANLILQEKHLEDSAAVLRYDLALVEKSIDSLSSRSRINAVASKFGLESSGVATKITRHVK